MDPLGKCLKQFHNCLYIIVRVTQYEDLGHTLAIREVFSFDKMWYSQTSTIGHFSLSTTVILFG